MMRLSKKGVIPTFLIPPNYAGKRQCSTYSLSFSYNHTNMKEKTNISALCFSFPLGKKQPTSYRK